MSRIPMNYRINLANKLRTPNGHLSVTARGSDNEFKNLKNLGAIGDSVQDMQMDYFRTLGLDGTLDDLFGSMIVAELDPNYRVTYTYKENYTVGDLPNLKNLFDVEICDMQFTSPLVLSSARNLRLETRDKVQFPEIVDFPELSLKAFYVKKLNKKTIELYNDIYLQDPVDGTIFGNQVFTGSCSLEQTVTYTVAPTENIDVTILVKDLANPQFDVNGDLTSFDIVEAGLIEGITFTNTYRGGDVSGGTITLDTPLDVSTTSLPILVSGNVTGGTTLTNTEEVPVNPDAIVGTVVKGTDTNPLPEGVSYNLIIPAEVNEDEAFTIRLETTGLPEGTVVEFIITGTNLNSADFAIGGLEGTFVLDANGNSELPYRTAADFTTEGLEIAEVTLVGLPVTGFINIIDTSVTPPPSVQVTPVLSPVDESGAIEFDIHIVSYPLGTVFNYTIYGDIDANDIVGDLTGSVTYNGVSPIRVSRPVVADFTTEGNEIAYLTINGFEADPNATAQITIVDSSQTPTYNLSSNTSITDEQNRNITLTLNTTNIPDGTVYNYTVTGIQPEDVTGDPLTGTMTINANTASVTFTTVADQTTEGDEILTFTLPDLSLATNVTITDSSQDLILVDPEIQIRFTADDYVPFVDTATPVITETSLYNRNIYQFNSTIFKEDVLGSGINGIYFPGNTNLFLKNSIDGFQLGGVADFQIHMITRNTVNTATVDNMVKFYDADVANNNQVFLWRNQDVYYAGVAFYDTVDFSRYGFSVDSLLCDSANGIIRQFKNGVEVATFTRASGFVYNIVNDFLIGGNDTDLNSYAMQGHLFEFEFYTGNDLTYFTNRHNEMVAAANANRVFEFHVETDYLDPVTNGGVVLRSNTLGYPVEFKAPTDGSVFLNPDNKSIFIPQTRTIYNSDVLNGLSHIQKFQLHLVYQTNQTDISSDTFTIFRAQLPATEIDFRRGNTAQYFDGGVKTMTYGAGYPNTTNLVVESFVYDGTKLIYIQNGVIIGETAPFGPLTISGLRQMAIGGLDVADGIGTTEQELNLYAARCDYSSDNYLTIHNDLKTRYGIV